MKLTKTMFSWTPQILEVEINLMLYTCKYLLICFYASKTRSLKCIIPLTGQDTVNADWGLDRLKTINITPVQYNSRSLATGHITTSTSIWYF